MKKQGPFSPDAREFLWLLKKHNVRYVIVGGEAVIYYGHARLTGDIDIFYGTSPENVDRLLAVLKEFWGGTIPGLKSPKELKEKGAIFQFGVPPHRIDLLSELEKVDFEKAWDRKSSQVIVRRGKRFRIHYIGIEDLIENKRAVGRNRDMDDLAFLLKAKRKKLARSK